ncbi:MAG: hypothetical protein J7L69_01280 [Desulfobulbaceae bacterium]|nr:hypothetical protein [Desulfobulbaceae bacterium]
MYLPIRIRGYFRKKESVNRRPYQWQGFPGRLEKMIAGRPIMAALSVQN